MALFVGVILLAVVIDRRAPVLVAMPFVIYTLAQSAGPGAPTVSLVTLIVSIVLMIMTLVWDRARGLLLRPARRAWSRA